MSPSLILVLYLALLLAATIGIPAIFDRMSRAVFAWMFGLLTLGVVAAFVGLAQSRDDLSFAGQYAAHTSAIMVWIWLEVANRSLESVTMRRLGFARGSTMRQEAMWVVPALGILALTWNGVNHLGIWAFGLYWCAHLSLRLTAYASTHARAGGPLVWPPWFAVGLPPAQMLSVIFPLAVTVMTAVCALCASDALTMGVQTSAGAGRLMLAAQASVGCVALWADTLPLEAWLKHWALRWQNLSWRRSASLNAAALRDVIQG